MRDQCYVKITQEGPLTKLNINISPPPNMYSKGVATPSFRYVGLTEAWRRFSRDDDLWSVKCGLTSRKYTTHFLLLPFKVHTFPVWLFDLIPIVSNEPMSVSHAAERPGVSWCRVTLVWWQWQSPWYQRSWCPGPAAASLFTIYRGRCWPVTRPNIVTAAAAANWSQHLNWLHHTLRDNILYIIRTKNFTLQQMFVVTDSFCVKFAKQIPTENMFTQKREKSSYFGFWILDNNN